MTLQSPISPRTPDCEAAGPAPGSGAGERARVLGRDVIDPAVLRALAEDRGTGDLTSETAVPAGARARARLLAKSAGVLAGTGVFARAFELCDPGAEVLLRKRDGERVTPGEEVASVTGDARALLLAERTALNFLQRMSGIATRTARLVELAAGRVRVLDTRKTTPGLRAFEKHAVLCGGGENHRRGLDDQVLVKENHLALSGRGLEELLTAQRAALGEVTIVAEARTPAEARAAVRAGADVVMLDNLPPAEIAALVPALRALAAGRDWPLEIEASGGIDEETLEAIARTGVDRVSVGALTHSVRALDLALYLEPAP